MKYVNKQLLTKKKTINEKSNKDKQNEKKNCKLKNVNKIIN